MTVTVEDLVSKYIKLRDKKQERKRKFDEETAQLTEAMKFIEGQLARILMENGVERMGSDSGVTFFQESTSATVADKDVFFQFLQDTENWHLADIRAAKKHIGEWLEDGQELPPGINWKKARVVRVNRA